MSQWRVTGKPSGVRGGSRTSAAQHRAHTIDCRATAVARGRGGIDLALGETLLELSRGNYLMDLGVSKLVDYAYERLGLPKRTLYMLMKLATGLRSRPLLRRAVAVGAVSPRKALTIMSAAVGEDEAAWTGALAPPSSLRSSGLRFAQDSEAPFGRLFAGARLLGADPPRPPRPRLASPNRGSDP